jgi:hypothetical protein
LSHTFSLFISPSLDSIYFYFFYLATVRPLLWSHNQWDRCSDISSVQTTDLCESVSQLVVPRGYPLTSNTVRCRFHQYLLGAVFARLPCPSLARLAFQPEISQIVPNNALSIGRLSFGAYSAQDIAGPLCLARICTALRRSSFWARAVHQLGERSREHTPLLLVAG